MIQHHGAINRLRVWCNMSGLHVDVDMDRLLKVCQGCWWLHGQNLVQ